METSIFLARVIGPFCIISAAAVMVRYKEYLAIEKEASKNLILLHFSGFTILILGLLIIVSHPVWTKDWRIVITLLGWVIFLKGVLRIFFPKFVVRMIEKKQNNLWFILGEIAFLLVGFYLLYYGFFVKHNIA